MYGGIGLATIGGFLCRIDPICGFSLAGVGTISTGISANFKNNHYIVKQRKLIKIRREYLFTYNIFSDQTKEKFSSALIGENKVDEGNWEDYEDS